MSVMARRTYQDMILALERYWADYGCVLMHAVPHRGRARGR